MSKDTNENKCRRIYAGKISEYEVFIPQKAENRAALA
jgi:hypothetical protein